MRISTLAVVTALLVGSLPSDGVLPPAGTEGMVIIHKKQGAKVAQAQIVMPNAWDALKDILDRSREPSVRASVAYALANMAYGPDLPEQWLSAQYYQVFMGENPDRYFPGNWLYGTVYLDYSVILWNLGRKDEALDLLAEAVENVKKEHIEARHAIRIQTDIFSRMFFETEKQEGRFRAIQLELGLDYR